MTNDRDTEDQPKQLDVGTSTISTFNLFNPLTGLTTHRLDALVEAKTTGDVDRQHAIIDGEL